MTRRVVRIGLVVAAPVLLVLLLRAFVFDVYRVDSGSMEPTIHGAADGGEVVLVRYDRARSVERFDLVVVLREGEREPVVKRVVGLPGEEVRIVEGDLLVDGAKLGPEVPRPPPVPVFRSDRNDLEQDFDLTGEWERGGRVAWTLGGEAGASWRHALTDDHLAPDGRRVAGQRQVGDAVLECGLAMTSPVALTLSLTEEGDEFVARIDADDSGVAAAILRRRAGGETELAGDSGPWDYSGPLVVRFSNVDDCLALEIRGHPTLRATYPSNEPLDPGPDPRRVHRRPRAGLTITGHDIDVLWLALSRDLHYTELGTFGTAEPVQLGPGEVFLLGDNSGESVDGREWGPVTLDEILGRPAAVVWPPGRARILSATRAPPQSP